MKAAEAATIYGRPARATAWRRLIRWLLAEGKISPQQATNWKNL